MAKNPATTPSDPNEIPPAMDYAAHTGTYAGFISFLKWGIFATILILVALYFFIVAGNTTMGIVFLVALPIVAAARLVMGPRRA